MKLFLSAALALLPFLVFAQPAIEPSTLPASLAEVRAKALQNDYQAQRNLAYTYGSGSFELKGKTYPLAACGWYTAIVHLHPTRANDVDLGNVWMHCSKLNLSEHGRALSFSSGLVNRFMRPQVAK